MRLHTDCSFRIGAQHLRSGLPCQDYALAESWRNRAHALVSDGCSSGARTDIGARVVALAQQQAWRFDHNFKQTVEITQTILGLSDSDLLATKVCVAVTSFGVFAEIHGDGVVAFRHRDGGLRIVRLEWDRNMPSYPIYAADNYEPFAYDHGGLDVGAAKVIEVRDGALSERMMQVQSVMRGYRFTEHTDISAVAVFSDGVCQVDGVDSNGVINWIDVVTELMAFKTKKGDFVKRRMNAFLRDVEKIGRGPIDDIAMAAIVIEEE